MRYHRLFLVIVIMLGALQLGAPEAAASSSGQGSEIPQMTGFPIEVGPFQPGPSYRGVVLADLDDDGDLEMVYASHNCPDQPLCGHIQLLAWDHQGNSLPGFPVLLEGNIEAPPAVADMDGDGDQEIVFRPYAEDWEHSTLFVFDHQGRTLPGFPITVESDYGFVTLVDINLDGYKEILFTGLSGIWAVAHDGSLLSDGWPIDLLSVTGGVIAGINGPLSVADVDGDGRPEIAVVIDRRSLFLLSNDGEVVQGWPKTFELRSSILGDNVIFADLDGDVDLEVIYVRNIEGASISNQDRKVEVYAYHHDGELLAGWPQEILPEITGAWMVSLPTVTDLDGDGEIDIVVAASHNPHFSDSAYGHGARIFAWDLQGSLKQGFPYRPHPHWGTGAISMITAVDSDGDGRMELYADAVHTEDNLGYVLGIDWHGRNLKGFPLRPLGSTYPNGAIIDDVDADGDYEMAVVGMAFREANGPLLRMHLYDLPSAYSSKDMSWPTYYATNQREGYLKRRYKDWRFVHAGTRMGGGR